MKKAVFAVFGDIHSNLEALTAVLADMDAQGVTHRVCLGDIVGYAASPAQCLKLVRSLNCPILRGNHDEAVASANPAAGMREPAQASIAFSQSKLKETDREFLKKLPLVMEEDGCQFVHASLSKPSQWKYITTPDEAAMHFDEQQARICFSGHTHHPRVWGCKEGEWPMGHLGNGTVKLNVESRYLINVGSVGQPRDLNPDACYVIYRPEQSTVTFRRVPYDIARARQKISRAKLPIFLGQRLALGR